MPRFDGRGPRGEGPFTGCGHGFCVLRLSAPEPDTPVLGYAGLRGRPVCSRRAWTSGAIERDPADILQRCRGLRERAQRTPAG